MRVALAQCALGPDVAQNLASMLDFLERAAQAKAQLVLYPELCLSPFFPRLPGQGAARFAMSADDAGIEVFRHTCARVGVSASPNVYLREGERLFDASLMIEADGRLLGVSKMVHVAQLPGFFEQDYYTPSDTGFQVYSLGIGQVGIVVCFDRHYPESIRACALRGASLILIPTANTSLEPREIFECELRAAAFQNGVFIAMCNRVGREGDVTFCGESTVIDPSGNVLAKAGSSEALLLADIDLAEVAAVRTKRPYLALRRPEMYV
jgi:predicted amidohydrolase